MALQKVTYVDKETVISAENLNNIQDAVIDNEEKVSSLQTLVGDTKVSEQISTTTHMVVSDLLFDDNSNVINETLIPDTIARKSDVTTDYSVNDPTDLAYIKNRTHYEDKSLLADEMADINALNGGSWNSQDGIVVTQITISNQTLTVGETYTIVIDGQCYTVIGNEDMVNAMGGSGIVSFGDTEAFITEDLTLLNSVVGYGMNQGTSLFMVLACKSDSIPVECKLYRGSGVMQLDEKFIPSTIARVSDISKHYRYGTEDLIAGETPLATGQLYFVYE